MVVVPGSFAYNPCSISFGEAKAQVARVLSGQSTDEVLSEAGDAIREALRWWGRFRYWAYLRVIDTSLTATAGVAEVDLPADFHHVYSVRTDTRTLFYIDPRMRDRIEWNQQATGEPYAYHLYNKGSALQLVLVPTPGAAYNLSVRYHRLVTVNPGEQDPLDVPDLWADVILNKAKALLLSTRGGHEGREANYEARAMEGIRRARADDAIIPDEIPAMMPMAGYAMPGYPPTHAWFWVLNDYGW